VTDDSELPDINSSVLCEGTIYGVPRHMNAAWRVFGRCDGCENQFNGLFCDKHLLAILATENESTCINCGDPYDLKDTIYKMERL
jgi:hypothetical protein